MKCPFRSDHFVIRHNVTFKLIGTFQDGKFYMHNTKTIKTNGYFHVGWSDFNISQGQKHNPDSVYYIIFPL